MFLDEEFSKRTLKDSSILLVEGILVQIEKAV
jgi:hypothetical protein